MENIRLIKAPIDILCSECTDDNYKDFKREYDKFSESDDDPVGHWMKNAKAKGETNQDDIILTLLVELHRKIDRLEKTIQQKPDKRIPLDNKIEIDSIGYEYFKIDGDMFVQDKMYYARINMPSFPKRDIPVFVRALSGSLVYIVHMHERDIKDWDNYVASRERAMIRELRSNNDD